LLGEGIEGMDVGETLAQPDILQAVQDDSSLDVELAGIGGAGRKWLLSVRSIANGLSLVRLVDRSAARAAERMRVDFVANASHELRTPLATLVGYAETLQDQGLEIDEDTRFRFTSIMHEEARRMQGVVEDLISLSRIEAERFSTPSDSVALEPLVEQAMFAARRMAEVRNSRLESEIDEDLPKVTADAAQILQLLDNLVTNALRYGRPGTPVRVGARREGRFVRLTVSDQGEGIPEKHIPRVTERFYRVDASRSRALGGTGLGLSIVKHIVERHRGRLHIESELGRGTDVHVLLPAAAAG